MVLLPLQILLTELNKITSSNKMALPRHILHPPSPSPSHPPPLTKISPTLLLIVIIVSALFFISGLVFLLIRFLKKRPNSSPSSSSTNNQSNGDETISTAEALQRQLQQLFSLTDSGLDQASIDALPMFTYKEILGPKEPFDCAVCLCEFSPKDKLRLLPNCSHAFHIKCIDTWLQSNSSCPLCRGAILAPGLLLESPASESDQSTGEINGSSSVKGKTAQIEENCGDQKGVLPVRLGKFRKLEGENGDSFVGEASNSNLDARRCYSMGSYQYVVGNTSLRVTLCPRRRKAKKAGNSGSPPVDGDLEGRKISSVSRGDSYSISKIWLWKKKGAAAFSSSSGIAQIDLPSLGVETELSVMERTDNV